MADRQSTHWIVCCDGTWNTIDDLSGDVPTPTNVVRLWNCLAPTSPDGVDQRVYYHPGVGTNGWLDRLLGGATGAGLSKNVKSAYKWLAEHWRPGDKIWLFGFSRGAFTARSVGGMIAKCGLVDLGGMKPDAVWQAVDTVFARYRAFTDPAHPPKIGADLNYIGVAPGQSSFHSVPIHFIGVWDTVGSLGIPDDWGVIDLLFDRPKRYRFHDTELSPVYTHARHAIALDERRQTFLPTLWTKIPPGPTVKQVWFPGAHCDVGGGYVNKGLSDRTLDWMIGEAREAGLGFDPMMTVQIVQRGFQDVLHNSATGVFAKMKTCPRAAPIVDPLSQTADVLDQSALARQARPPIAQYPYRPTRTVAPGAEAKVTVSAREHWVNTGIFLQKGRAYRVSADGEWRDASIPAGPDGIHPDFRWAKLGYAVAWVFEQAQAAFRFATRRYRAQAPFARRFPEYPWFMLMGVIANEAPVPDTVPQKQAEAARDKAPLPHQVFAIGSGATIAPNADGYLYVFANDAWGFYENNSGRIEMTVSG